MATNENSLEQKREDSVILEEIKKKNREITQFVSYDGDAYRFKRLANELLDLVVELSSSDNQEIRFNAEWSHNAISHTIDKEVNYVEYDYDRMIKKNAAKIRKNEYYMSIKKAAMQLDMDLGSLRY